MLMPVSNKNKKKMQWSAVIRRPGFILPKRELSASKQDTDASQTKSGAIKVKNTPTIRSKTKVSSSAVGTKSVDTHSSTQEIPHSVVIHKTASETTTTTTKEGSVATDNHAVRPTVVSAPSILHTGTHPPFTGAQSTFGSEHAVSRGNERRPLSESIVLKNDASESTVSENDGRSLGGSFRLATALQERTNHVLDRKVPATRKQVHCNGDGSELPVTANGSAKTKAKVKSDNLVATKDRPQDQPGAHPSPPFPILYSYGKKVTMIDPNLMIFVIDMVPPEICNAILDLTSRHVRHMTANGDADKCWRSLYTYTKMDIPCAEVPGLGDIMQRIMLSVVGIIGEM
jgi:hypothetical protein